MERLRIAYFSPLNPLPTGISDYSEELLPALAELAEVDLFVDGYLPSNPAIRERFPIYDCAEFPSRDAECRYDVNLYQMGNSCHHAGIHRMLLRYPGIVVLHEVFLHHFFLEVARQSGDSALYLREMAYAGGPAAVETGIGVWLGDAAPPLFSCPLVERIADASLGIIVHSDFARRQLVARTATPVAVVPAHVVPPPTASPAERARARAELRLSREAIVFGAFGYATPPKRLDVAVRAFARLHRLLPEARLLIVGEVRPAGWLDPLIAELGLTTAVMLTGPLPFDRFQRSIAATDVCLSLRFPTAGETSASLLRILAAGIPAIVSDTGSFSEFPGECCRKVPVDATEEAQLAQAMIDLAIDDDLRQRMGQSGRSLVLASHAPTLTAERYRSFIDAVLQQVGRDGGAAGASDRADVTLPVSAMPAGVTSRRIGELWRNLVADVLGDLGVQQP